MNNENQKYIVLGLGVKPVTEKEAEVYKDLGHTIYNSEIEAEEARMQEVRSIALLAVPSFGLS